MKFRESILTCAAGAAAAMILEGGTIAYIVRGDGSQGFTNPIWADFQLFHLGNPSGIPDRTVLHGTIVERFDVIEAQSSSSATVTASSTYIR